MGFLCWTILILWSVYAYFALKFAHKLLNKDLKYLFEPKVNIYSKSNSASRYDQIELNKCEVYFGCVFIMPIRLLLTIPVVIMGIICGKLTWIVFGLTEKNYLEPKSDFYRACVKWPCLIFSRVVFFIWGFYTMPLKTVNITDFWTNYKPIQDASKPYVTISNHVSYLDMWLLLTIEETCSFLGKWSVQYIPVVGFYAKLRQSLFLKRGDKKQGDKNWNMIGNHIKEIEEGTKKSLLVFAEGTTTGGRGLMKMKKGAFAWEKPISVYSLYFGGKFIPCLDLIKDFQSAFILFSLFRNKVTFLKFNEPIDPLWILKEKGIKPGQEGNWEIIATEFRELMSFAFNFVNCGGTFRDKCDFDCEVQGITKKQLFSRA